MSSSQHSPRRAPSLRDASRRDLLAVLENNRQSTADVRPAVYVARVGSDVHLARNQGSDIVYRVGGPAQSFKPGTIVLLGSNTGRPGESIIALPSPAQKGASAYPESRFGGSIDFPAPDDPPALAIDPCGAPAISEHLYYGIHVASGVANVWEYMNGTFLGVADTATVNINDAQSANTNTFRLIGSSTLQFVRADGTNFVNGYGVSWDLGSAPQEVARSQALDADSIASGAFSGVGIGTRRSRFVTSTSPPAELFTDSGAGSGFKGGYNTTGWTAGQFIAFGGLLLDGRGLAAVGGKLICEGRKQSDLTPAFFSYDPGSRVWSVTHPYTLLGAITDTNITSGEDIGDGRVIIAKSVSGNWIALFRSADGSGDVAHWPTAWGLVETAGIKPKLRLAPNGNDVVVYPFNSNKLLVRTDVRAGTLDAGCSVPGFAVQAGPGGLFPNIMLPRD